MPIPNTTDKISAQRHVRITRPLQYPTAGSAASRIGVETLPDDRVRFGNTLGIQTHRTVLEFVDLE